MPIDPQDIVRRYYAREEARRAQMHRMLARYDATNPMEVHALRNMLEELGMKSEAGL